MAVDIVIKSVAPHQRLIIGYGLVVLMAVVTIICIFMPSITLFRFFTPYTFYIMLAWLVVSFVCFVLGWQRPMIWGLLCCGALCLYLKQSTNKMLRLPALTANPAIQVSHISLSNAEGDYEQVIQYLMNVDVDILSFQELTPDWNEVLHEKLVAQYPHVHTLTRLDQYGMGFFSKIPIQSLDTIYFQQIPSLTMTAYLPGDQPFELISCQMMPPVNPAAFTAIMNHFEFITQYLNNTTMPAMVLGDFHLPPWAYEVQRFKEQSELKDGRRDVQRRNLDGSVSLPRIPVEHILFSEPWECTSFSELGNTRVGRLGITGTYQMQYEAATQ